jgi:hypothetical protein
VDSGEAERPEVPKYSVPDVENDAAEAEVDPEDEVVAPSPGDLVTMVSNIIKAASSDLGGRFVEPRVNKFLDTMGWGAVSI